MRSYRRLPSRALLPSRPGRSLCQLVTGRHRVGAALRRNDILATPPTPGASGRKADEPVASLDQETVCAVVVLTKVLGATAGVAHAMLGEEHAVCVFGPAGANSSDVTCHKATRQEARPAGSSDVLQKPAHALMLYQPRRNRPAPRGLRSDKAESAPTASFRRC
jgi:hypothetical protein